VGTLNDPSFADDPSKAGDSRWVHRPARDVARYAQRHDPSTVPGRIHAGLRHMISLRQQTPALAGGRLAPFWTHNVSVLGYQRFGEANRVLVLGNFSEFDQHIAAHVLGAQPDQALDLISGQTLNLRGGLTLAAYQTLWLALPPVTPS
jgi:amylosucrase